jgi:glycosyltransferase involved in cell wall biosynthesis
MHPKLAEPRRDENRIVVLVPFRDPGPQIDDLIESLLEQSYGNFLAIFIDDASVRDYARKFPEDSRFRCIRRSVPHGFFALGKRWVALCGPMMSFSP